MLSLEMTTLLQARLSVVCLEETIMHVCKVIMVMRHIVGDAGVQSLATFVGQELVKSDRPSLESARRVVAGGMCCLW